MLQNATSSASTASGFASATVPANPTATSGSGSGLGSSGASPIASATPTGAAYKTEFGTAGLALTGLGATIALLL